MTRRKNSLINEKEKKRVDNPFRNSLGSGDRSLSSLDKALGGEAEKPITLNEGFWDEFITVANVLYKLDEEADIYDVFNFIRIHYNSGQEYSAGLLNRVDKEITRELGPW